jgi:hypothetical protein
LKDISAASAISALKAQLNAENAEGGRAPQRKTHGDES